MYIGPNIPMKLKVTGTAKNYSQDLAIHAWSCFLLL